MGKKIIEQIKRRKKIVAIVAVLVLIILVGLLYASHEKNKVYKEIKVDSKLKLDNSIDKEYVAFGSGVLAYNNDGASYYAGGKEVFNIAYSITNPLVATSKSYAVVAEKNACNIVLIGKDGSQSAITSTYAIVDIDVSNQGVVAATLDDGEANYIEFYDKDGTKLVSGRTVLSGDGYPLDISLSGDANKLVASYLSISEGTAQSKVVFYNYTSVGENEVDRIVGGFNQYTDTLVPDVEFINDSTAVAMGDNMFSIYSIDEKPTLTYEKKEDDKIDSVFYSNKYIGIIYESNSGDYSQLVKVYDTKGKVQCTKTIDFKYNGVIFAGENIVFYDETSCKIYSFKGKERWNHTFDDININKVISIGTNKFMIVGDSAIEEITLK